MRTRLGLVLLFGAGLANAAWAQASARFDGQYTGEMVLKGIVSGDCTEPPPGALYPLTVSGGMVRFKYLPRFDTVLRGTVDDKGNLKASARVKSGVVQMTGRIQGNKLAAEVRSPSCIYTFQTRN